MEEAHSTASHQQDMDTVLRVARRAPQSPANSSECLLEPTSVATANLRYTN